MLLEKPKQLMLFKFLILFSSQSFDNIIVSVQHIVNFSLVEYANLRNVQVNRVFIVFGSEVQKNKNKRIGDCDAKVCLEFVFGSGAGFMEKGLAVGELGADVALALVDQIRLFGLVEHKEIK